MIKLLSGFGFLTGASYPFRTLVLFIRNPGLFSYIIVPIFLNIFLGIVFYFGLFFLGGQGIQDLLGYLINRLDAWLINLPSWLKFLDYILVGLAWLLRFLLGLILFIVTGFLLAQFGVFLGAPWYGKLSEKLEEMQTGSLTIIEVGIFKDIIRAILFELKKLFLLLTLGIPLFLLNFIPGLGTLIVTMGGITLTATLTCLDFLDSPLERRRLKFREKLKIIFQSLPASAGFSLVCLGLISVPLLNLLTIPLCVASGTIFVCDRVLNCQEKDIK
jgi:CysZ protein